MIYLGAIFSQKGKVYKHQFLKRGSKSDQPFRAEYILCVFHKVERQDLSLPANLEGILRQALQIHTCTFVIDIGAQVKKHLSSGSMRGGQRLLVSSYTEEMQIHTCGPSGPIHPTRPISPLTPGGPLSPRLPRSPTRPGAPTKIQPTRSQQE